MVPLMSESMDHRLTLAEYLKLTLHLLVCAWCARYLKQIKFLRTLLRGQRAPTRELVPSLAVDARERIAKSLKAQTRKP